MRVFGELEMGYFREVLESRQLGWAEGGMVTRFEQAFAAKVNCDHAIARNSAMSALAEAVSISGAGTALEVICDPVQRRVLQDATAEAERAPGRRI